MFISWFLSFWLPNVAVCAMMVPIVEAIIKALHIAAKHHRKEAVDRTTARLSLKDAHGDKGKDTSAEKVSPIIQ